MGCCATRWNPAAALVRAALLPGLLLAAFAAYPACAEGADGFASGGYKLVWSDEFDQDGPPDEDSWSFEKGFVRNRELQWYQPDNAFCEEGRLVIEARREHRPNPDFQQPPRRGLHSWAAQRKAAHYTSASLHSGGKHAWRYGRFVARARIPIDAGAWPAFWTVGYGRWPAAGEIDIMEYYRGTILANAAWLGSDKKIVWDAAKKPLTELGGPDWAGEFHVWRMDWTPEAIELYVDDLLVNSIDVNRATAGGDYDNNPFRKPQYLRLNLAVGGQHGGDPSSASFPIRYEVDYVRVYQRQSSGDQRQTQP